MLRRGLLRVAGGFAGGARTAMKPKNLLMGATAAAGVVAVQSAYVMGTYKALPPPLRERMHGVEKWMEDKDWVPARVKHLIKRISKDADTRVIQSDDVSRAAPTGSKDTKRVIIIGDSLVVGIGCKESPVMPVALCRQLASLLKVDVQWRALGVDGGDVRTIHSNVLSLVDDFEREGKGAKVDAVIILCGLNDFKKLWMGRTSSVFRRDLDSFMTELRSKVGDECLIFLPAIPMEEILLPEPLKTFAISISTVFDEEKRDKAAREALTHFIPKPAMELWLKAKEGGKVSIVAEDGVHPNERGYDVYAAYIAEETAKIMSGNMLAVRGGSGPLQAIANAAPSVSMSGSVWGPSK